MSARLPPDDQIQSIAADIGISESAFVAVGKGEPNYDIRYFRPEREVPFCGHATITAAVALTERTLDLVDPPPRSDLIPVAIGRRPTGTARRPAVAAVGCRNERRPGDRST